MGIVARLALGCAVGALFVLGVPSSTGAQAAEVVIETQITFFEDAPPSGTFEVIEGADILGCSSGSFVDPDASPIEGSDLIEITKVLTCESGPKTGTITILFIPGEGVAEPDRQTGPWEIEEGTGDFAGLVGGGEFEVNFDSETTGVETLSGTVDSPESTELAQTGSEQVMAIIVGGGLIVVGLAALAFRPKLDTR